ncbi:DUF4424 family protein [Chelativorans sp. J32]|uniref:DUF4424 family protein n=1 Tax=Chelativorans sp. J32 TaxID=935840 RepID=UPI0004BCE94C|nr:DUF4424 family protein [Chelativorans sp. J32]
MTIIRNLTITLLPSIFFLTATQNITYANDSSAVLGAGGLELTTSHDIAMESEDLYLSPSEVRVRYAFRNESQNDITTTVAFPLPEIDQAEYFLVELPEPDQENFVGFQVIVDGEQIVPRMEQQAVQDDGKNVTEALKEAGVPVNAKLDRWDEQVRSLPEQIRKQLVDNGLLYVVAEDAGDQPVQYGPTWKLKTSFYWEQTFPAGKTIMVEHRYKPIIGKSVVMNVDDLNSMKGYCFNDNTLKGVSKLLEQAGSDGITALEMSYILTTGANWKGPIGEFRLTVNKEDANAVLSSCMAGLSETGPTTLGLKRAKFKPEEDIRLLLFEAH